jgi:hypothetical protein
VPYNKAIEHEGSFSGAYVPYNKVLEQGASRNTPRGYGKK